MDALDLKGRTFWEFFQVCLFAFSIGLYSWHNIWEECFCKSWSQDRSGWHAVHRRSDASLPSKEHDKIEGLTWSSGFWWNNQTIGYCRRGKDGEQTVQARFLDSAYFSIQWPKTISGVSLHNIWVNVLIAVLSVADIDKDKYVADSRFYTGWKVGGNFSEKH